ncbi:MAG TPA: CPBP family intramembrane glutamic endopeptidase [Steroidobacteraceae bacterium]|nr:CPBP family intramembrane glutamic endopeptidase [Steroidobacteraceae bacterium]
MRALASRYPLMSFIAINYAISWTFLYPAYQMVLHSPGRFPPLALIGLIGAYGPSIAAIIVVGAIRGGVGVRELLGKFLLWRVGARWYLVALLVPIGVYLAAVLLQMPGHADLRQGLAGIPLAIIIALPFGPLAEELGWRGFFLPELLRRYSPLKSTLIVGCVWSAWHLASFSFPGAAIPSYLHVNAWSVFLFFCDITTLSFVFTFVFRRTGGSVLLAVLVHLAFDARDNMINAFFPLVRSTVGIAPRVYITAILLMGALAVLCAIRDARKPGHVLIAEGGR